MNNRFFTAIILLMFFSFRAFSQYVSEGTEQIGQEYNEWVGWYSADVDENLWYGYKTVSNDSHPDYRYHTVVQFKNNTGSKIDFDVIPSCSYYPGEGSVHFTIDNNDSQSYSITHNCLSSLHIIFENYKRVTASSQIFETNQSNTTLARYFKNLGIELLAGYAHPTNIFKAAEYTVYPNSVWVKIYYENNLVTELQLMRNGNFFTSIEVISDNDFPGPFYAVEFWKDMAFQLIENYADNENTSTFERIVMKSIDEMSGTNLACLVLSLSWIRF